MPYEEYDIATALSELKKMSSLSNSQIAKFLDIAHSDLKDLSPSLEKYQKRLTEDLNRGMEEMFSKYSKITEDIIGRTVYGKENVIEETFEKAIKSISTALYRSTGMRGPVREVITEKASILESSMKRFEETRAESDFASLVENIAEFQKRIKELAIPKLRKREISSALETLYEGVTSLSGIYKESISGGIVELRKTLQKYAETGEEIDFKSIVQNMDIFRKKIEKMALPSELKPKAVEAISDLYENITALNKEYKTIIEETGDYAKSIEDVAKSMQDLSKKGIRQFQESLESIPFFGRIMTKTGWSEKLAQVLDKGFSGALDRSIKKSIISGKGGMGIGGLPIGPLPILGAVAAIAALGFVIKKLVDEFQDFRESMKMVAESFKTTELSTLKYSAAAIEARKALAPEFALIPERLPKTTEITAAGLAVSHKLRRAAIVENAELLEVLGRIIGKYKLTNDEVGNLALLMEQVGKSSTKDLLKMGDFLEQFREKAVDAGVPMEDLLSTIASSEKAIIRFGSKGADAFADLAASATVYGTSLDFIMDFSDNMLDASQSLEKFSMAQRQFARLGVPELGRALDLDEWMRAAVTGDIDAMMKNVVKLADVAVARYDKWMASGKPEDRMKAFFLSRTMDQFGIPMTELIKMKRREVELPEPEELEEEKLRRAAERILPEYERRGGGRFLLQRAPSPVSRSIRKYLEGKLDIEQLPENIRKRIEAEAAVLPPEVTTEILQQEEREAEEEKISNVVIDQSSIDAISRGVAHALGNKPLLIQIGDTVLRRMLWKEAQKM